MARKLVAELKDGDQFDQVFLLRSRTLREARNGSLYMLLELADRSGRIDGRLWDASQKLFDTLPTDKFVHAKGRIELYQAKLQAAVNWIEPAKDADIDVAEFLPATNKNVGQMMKRLTEIVESIKGAGLRDLLASFLGDAEFAKKFRTAPAAVEYHHACIGGLLEHTLSVTEMALLAASHYPDLDRDILIAGAIMHDAGKIEELSFEKSFSYTDAGQLVGHLYIGSRMIEERAKQIKTLKPETLALLTHLVLSHHGEYEFHSPTLPMTAEAITIHYLDNLDAKMNAFHNAMLKDRDSDSNWTEYNRMFERRLYKGK